MGGESISEHVVLLGALLGDQGLKRAPKELLVALGPGADDIDKQVSPGHGRDKAGVAEACGESPRQVDGCIVRGGATALASKGDRLHGVSFWRDFGLRCWRHQ
jgi:hypothetical protein